MNLALEREAPSLQQDKTGAIHVGNTRVLLELLIQAFQNGATPEAIVQQYDTSRSAMYIKRSATTLATERS